MRYSDSTLRVLRKHFGLSQSDLALFLGIDRSLLAHVEANRRSLPIGATLRMLPLLALLPPPHGSGATAPLPPDPAEISAATLDALQWQLTVCRHEAGNLIYALERQLPKLHAVRQRRALPGLLAARPPQAPPPAGLPGVTQPDPRWTEEIAAGAAVDLARFGVHARALLEARLAGLRAESAFLEGVVSEANAAPASEL